MQCEQDSDFFFSQSYDIGKMNAKYAPELEIQVRWLANFV